MVHFGAAQGDPLRRREGGTSDALTGSMTTTKTPKQKPKARKRVSPTQKKTAVQPGESEATPVGLTEQSFQLGEPGSKDDVAELLGEAYVQSMTSGAQAAEEFRDEVRPEEAGGPFVETSAETEFSSGSDTSPPDSDRAPLPIVSAQR